MPQTPTEAQVKRADEADPTGLTDIRIRSTHETALTSDTVAFTPEDRLP
ncbi:hypothetical protein OG909_12465 [Streptomyces sp. NBC_01754]|nr:hypothetical protein [Streptomyces sp. NBC_01754]WSC93040.1 hypothetical protein OG909_12465 [Streptomyces sp. NBC_01754]